MFIKPEQGNLAVFQTLCPPHSEYFVLFNLFPASASSLFLFNLKSMINHIKFEPDYL